MHQYEVKAENTIILVHRTYWIDYLIYQKNFLNTKRKFPSKVRITSQSWSTNNKALRQLLPPYIIMHLVKKWLRKVLQNPVQIAQGSVSLPKENSVFFCLFLLVCLFIVKHRLASDLAALNLSSVIMNILFHASVSTFETISFSRHFFRILYDTSVILLYHFP